MQTVITYLTLFLTGWMLHSQNNIEIIMTGFENSKGKVMVGLYNEKGDFLKKEYKVISSEIKDRKAIAIFTDVPDGTYAVSVFHDEDEDGKFNMLMGFIPLEDFGVSNNARARFGPPEWEDAKFEVKNAGVVRQEIHL